MAGNWGSETDPRLKPTSGNTNWGNVGDPNVGTGMPPTGGGGVNEVLQNIGKTNLWGTANDPRLNQAGQTTNNSTTSPYGYNYTGDPNGAMPPTTVPPTSAPPPAYSGSPWNHAPPQEDGSNFYGSPTHGATAGAADYAGVQDFSDAAYENARRYLDPQQAFDNRRLQQSYANMGLDPMSAMGGEMSDQMMRQHGDQDIAAAFAAMQFGQGIQDQMFNQNYMNTQQAGNMQQAQWNNDLGRGQLEVQRQLQDFAEMMGMENIDFRNWQANEDNMRWDQQLAMLLSGIGAPTTGNLGQGGTSNSSKPSVAPWGQLVDKARSWGNF